MQEENKKQSEQERKETLQRAVATVIIRLRNKTTSATHFYTERGLQPTTYLPIEKGQVDLRITTFYKLANVFGITFSEFARLVEKELPENFLLFEEEY